MTDKTFDQFVLDVVGTFNSKVTQQDGQPDYQRLSIVFWNIYKLSEAAYASHGGKSFEKAVEARYKKERTKGDLNNTMAASDWMVAIIATMGPIVKYKEDYWREDIIEKVLDVAVLAKTGQDYAQRKLSNG